MALSSAGFIVFVTWISNTVRGCDTPMACHGSNYYFSTTDHTPSCKTGSSNCSDQFFLAERWDSWILHLVGYMSLQAASYYLTKLLYLFALVQQCGDLHTGIVRSFPLVFQKLTQSLQPLEYAQPHMV